MSIAAIIDVKDFRGVNSIDEAVTSVLRSKDRIQQLIIISAYYREGTSLYEGWQEHHDELSQSMDVFIVPRLTSQILTTKYILHVNPMMNISTGGIDLLKAQAAESPVHTTKFTLRSIVEFPKNVGYSFFTGYILVVALFDFLWNFWEFGKYSRKVDARLDAVIHKGSYKWIAQKSFFDRIRNYSQATVIYEEGSSLILPKSYSKNFSYYLLKTHKSLKVGLWLFFYSMFFFTILLPALVAIVSIRDGTLLTAWFLMVTSVVWGGQMISAYFITKSYYKIPYLGLYVLAFPFYMITFLPVLIYAKKS